MGKVIKIVIPDDCELVQIGEGKWEQRKRKIGTLPRTWEEFCKIHPLQKGECHIDRFTDIINVIEIRNRDKYLHRTYLPNRKIAEAFIALVQLIQLKKCYNDGWEPDWTDGTQKWVIMPCRDDMQICCVEMSSRVLSFKDKGICGQFFENFRALIEIAKPLI